MYYLESCEICGRHGSVADEKDDNICKNCKFPPEGKKYSKTVKVLLKKAEDEEKALGD